MSTQGKTSSTESNDWNSARGIAHNYMEDIQIAPSTIIDIAIRTFTREVNFPTVSPPCHIVRSRADYPET